MNNKQLPVLKILHIPPIIDDIIRVVSFDNRISTENLRIKYLNSAVAIGDSDIEIKEIPQDSHGKNVLIPADINDFIITKARGNKTGYNNVFLAYLIWGIKNSDMKDGLEKGRIKELDKFISKFKPINDIETLQLRLDNLNSEKSTLEEKVLNISKEIAALNEFIVEQKRKVK